MTPVAGNNGNGRMEEKVNGIISDLHEIKTSLDKLNLCYQNFQLDYTKAHVIVEQKAEAAHNRIDKHDEELEKMKKNIEEMTKAISPLITQSKILAWGASILGASVIALIWGIITHTVVIAIP
jgi:hypothetical protein